MIQIKTRPNGMQFQFDPERPMWRFKGPSPKSTSPPPLPPPPKTISEILPEAAKAGEREGRRFRRKTGRASSVRTTAGSLVPAAVTTPGLKANLGGVTV